MPRAFLVNACLERAWQVQIERLSVVGLPALLGGLCHGLLGALPGCLIPLSHGLCWLLSCGGCCVALVVSTGSPSWLFCFPSVEESEENSYIQSCIHAGHLGVCVGACVMS